MTKMIIDFALNYKIAQVQLCYIVFVNQQNKSLRKCSFPVVEQSTRKKCSEIVPADAYSLTLLC